jgi:transposase-like protein
MERRKFMREFKLEPVRLIKGQGVSYVQALKGLGVRTSQLREWVKKLSDDLQHAAPRLRADEDELRLCGESFAAGRESDFSRLRVEGCA